MNIFFYTFLVLVILIPLRNVVLKFDNIIFFQYLNIVNFLYGIVFLGSLLGIKKIFESKDKTLILPFVIIIGYYLFICFLGPYYYTDNLITLKNSYLFMFIVYLYSVTNIDSWKKVKYVFLAMLFTNIYMVTYFWRWVRWINFDNFADKMKVVNGTFGDIGGSNEWAAFFSTYILILISVIPFVKSKFNKFSLSLLCFTNFLVLLFSFSRGAYLGFFVGLLFLLICKKKWIIIFVLSLMPVIYQYVLPDAVVDRINMSYVTDDYGDIQDNDINSRLYMWDMAIDMIKKRPLIGNGLNSFRYQDWNNPHNEHLNIIVQTGFIGYFMFLWLCTSLFKQSIRLWRTGLTDFQRNFGMGVSAALVSIFVANIFGDRWTYYVLTGYLWCFSGMVYVFLACRTDVSCDLREI